MVTQSNGANPSGWLPLIPPAFRAREPEPASPDQYNPKNDLPRQALEVRIPRLLFPDLPRPDRRRHPRRLCPAAGRAGRPAPAAPPPVESSDRATQLLAILQRDGRLVDFLMEDLAPYQDAQVGAAVRDVHRGCREALDKYASLARSSIWKRAAP